MFGTVIIDAYRKEEALEMADAIDDLCSPTDNYGWASAGIYCFCFDPSLIGKIPLCCLNLSARSPANPI